MLGLGNYISNVNASGDEPISLPHEGNYIYLEDKFKITNPNAGASPVTIHSPNNISFDDSVLEAFSAEVDTQNVYTENVSEALGNKYRPIGSVLSSGDTVTITGNILRFDNGQVWDGDDTSANGYVSFHINNSDVFKVYIDIQNTSSISLPYHDRVDSSGAFSVSKVIVQDASRFNIVANFIADGGVMVPGVRISNLTMTKS